MVWAMHLTAGNLWRKYSNPYPNTALVDTGMVIDNEGKHYDRFRHRIMFPIRNPRGQVIGLAAAYWTTPNPNT